MKTIEHNPNDLYPKYLNYAHAVEVPGGMRTLYISGLNGYESDGKTLPETFEAQGELIWRHLRSILQSAGMTVHNLVSLRVYLASPDDRAANTALRKRHLADHDVSLTVVCATLLDPRWKLEIEAVAAA